MVILQSLFSEIVKNILLFIKSHTNIHLQIILNCCKKLETKIIFFVF